MSPLGISKLVTVFVVGCMFSYSGVKLTKSIASLVETVTELESCTALIFVFVANCVNSITVPTGILVIALSTVIVSPSTIVAIVLIPSMALIPVPSNTMPTSNPAVLASSTVADDVVSNTVVPTTVLFLLYTTPVTFTKSGSMPVP